MAACNIDPVAFPDGAFHNDMNFANSALLKKLRDEWRAAHPHYSYTTSKDGFVRRLRRKPKSESTRPPVNTKPKRAAPVNLYGGLFDDFAQSVNTKPTPKPKAKAKPTAKPVNTKPSKPSSDRNRDRHSPGYMRDYMRRRRAR